MCKVHVLPIEQLVSVHRFRDLQFLIVRSLTRLHDLASEIIQRANKHFLLVCHPLNLIDRQILLRYGQFNIGKLELGLSQIFFCSLSVANMLNELTLC